MVKIEAHGIEIHATKRLNGDYRVAWCSDWSKLTDLVNAGACGLSRKCYGPATFGHTEVIADVAALRRVELVGRGLTWRGRRWTVTDVDAWGHYHNIPQGTPRYLHIVDARGVREIAPADSVVWG